MTNAIATAILSANNVFSGHTWIAWCLYSVAVLLLAWAAINAISSSGREQDKADPTSPPPSQRNEHRVTQEANPKQEQHVHIGDAFLRQLRENQETVAAQKPPSLPDPNLVFCEIRCPQLYR
jgi:hypothetical protein